MAGKKAIFESAISRVVLPISPIFFPSLSFALLAKLKLAPKGPMSTKLMELVLCVAALTFSLPASVALFKQQAVLLPEEMEEQFRALKDSSGQLVKEFYFNKGL